MILDYFEIRAIPGVEAIDGNRYRRTVRLNDAHAFIEAEPDKTRDILWVRVMSDRPFALADLVMRLRRLFDLDAQPQAIGATIFQMTPLIGPLVEQRPGLRIPGAFDGFELAIRAVLGQQVSVKGATTIAGRLVETYGDQVTPPGENWPSFLFPEPQTLVRDGSRETRYAPHPWRYNCQPLPKRLQTATSHCIPASIFLRWLLPLRRSRASAIGQPPMLRCAR